MNEAGALALARGARHLLIKVGQDVVRIDRARDAISDEQARAYLVHDDGLMRVPVLVWKDLLVRGYTEELYREALDSRGSATADG